MCLPPPPQELQVPIDPPTWAGAYERPQQPLVLDVGCGYGRFLLALRWVLPGRGWPLGGPGRGLRTARYGSAAVPRLTRLERTPPCCDAWGPACFEAPLVATPALPSPGRRPVWRSKAMPGHNMLGLEIRGPIIERANRWAQELALEQQVLFLRWASLAEEGKERRRACVHAGMRDSGARYFGRLKKPHTTASPRCSTLALVHERCCPLCCPVNACLNPPPPPFPRGPAPRLRRGNATITLAHTLASYPGPLDLACVQFPDPHFKARHK